MSRSEDLPDDALVAQAMVDRQAFADLYERYRPSIYGYALNRLGDPHLAEDVTSKVFLRAFRALPSYQSGSFRGWIFQIARNTITDTYRRSRPTTTDDALAAWPDPAPGPADVVEVHEARAAVHRMIDQLPDQQATIIRLRLHGMTGQEIADALGISLSAVKSAQFRAFNRIRDLMGDDR
ncbi:MAG TPA: sigma-70 family RNA polymerase sigma factor [Thermomicrobiales bacterium]|nr:sigma-70 family RNA polymerase sigma factor [Thermomicrobiales bacterium]